VSDTIFALATAPGRAAVAIIRLSGPGASAALEAIGAGRLRPRVASLRTLRGLAGEMLDRALVLWFPAPGSYTGEDCAELQTHGGPAVVEAVMAELLGLGLRLAAPGEFTRRAFENGKLDLGQAEAVADLVDAESAAQARQALSQLNGALGRRYGAWRDRLVEILSVLEAAVDFPDEDVPQEVEAQAREPLSALLAELDLALADEARGRRVRDGYRVAIIGAPNAGKSSLFNALARRDAAIVTPIAGATRDVIEAPLLIEGFKVLLADMAGLREARDPVEVEGVRRARAWAEAADLRLWVVDWSDGGDGWRLAADMARSDDACVLNKIDLAPGRGGLDAAQAAKERGLEALEVSLVSNELKSLEIWLSERIRHDLSGSDFPAVTRARHGALLATARSHLTRALESIGTPELAAEDVRLAVRALAIVTGAIGVEDVLDRVFSTFCIGK
jgi:tRNA modification GTPase